MILFSHYTIIKAVAQWTTTTYQLLQAINAQVENNKIIFKLSLQQ